jgi:two-component system chemotaxis response regulator CheY
MSENDYTILLVDPDARVRALLSEQLATAECTVLQASDGVSALRHLAERDVRLVVTELYLKSGVDACLIHAIRRSKSWRRTRTIALTSHATAADRDWAMRAGADAFLIKPTRAERLRYVVNRLVSTRGPNASVPMAGIAPISRRDSLDVALNELEGGALDGSSAIVFSRGWWETLTRTQQTTYRKRAKRAGVNLRSDSLIGDHFVEVRGTPASSPLKTERAESPYRG